ncbi:MAG: 1-(5-phosphoribosyl)-5-[(5-phosphoribosylamino)methylideneamino]imidazole-4-carboxamide isomerase [Proteobacteria bacterium]|nr:1-(5-phosphoribosyl)-5-[(5-phosphoribosylamino)methylideneamino]imidazole-4-carboxamide isomerase [Pseudomonadota bacterium]
MILYPAIDLKDGQCVRLVQGDMNKATIFNDSPAEQAKAFWDAGCRWLHVVDLDGAIEGFSVNSQAIDAILEACPSMRIQLGGGIRGMKKIEHWLDKGISRVILGTVAAENPDIVREAAKEFPNQIAVGIDARWGEVATRGWAKDAGIEAHVLANKYEASGVAAIIYTDIDCDGVMKGPNIHGTMHMLENAVDIPIIASGGVSNMSDLQDLKTAHRFGSEYKGNLSETRPLNGVIVGRALYDKEIDIKEALALLKKPLDPC